MTPHAQTGRAMSASTDAPRRLTVADIAKRYADGQRLPMLTAYDYPTAQILDEAGIPLLLVGDSLGQVLLGYESTVRVTMTEMLHHTKAVVRGSQRALVIGDMPFLTYATVDEALENAGRFLQEAGAQAVKVEGGVRSARIIEALVKAGIPVMGHIGWTPQAQHGMGGKVKVQGKDRTQARALLADALAVQEAGAFSIVLELVPGPARRGDHRPAAHPDDRHRGRPAAAAARSRSSPTCSASATSCRATRGRTRTCARRSATRRGRTPPTSRRARSRATRRRSGWTTRSSTRRWAAARRDRASGIDPGWRASRSTATSRALDAWRMPQPAATTRVVRTRAELRDALADVAAAGRARADDGLAARGPPRADAAGARRQRRRSSSRSSSTRASSTRRPTTRSTRATRPATSRSARPRASTSSSRRPVEEIYPPGFDTTVSVGAVAQPLEGAARPGHFDGVATVVAILFDLVGAERAYFGQKDAQQVMVIRQMARDLAIGTEVVTCPTVREPDGLALSSRNVHLSPAERRRGARSCAGRCSPLGRRVGARASARRRRCCATRCATVLATEPLANVEYVSVADGDDARRARRRSTARRSLSLAVRFGDDPADRQRDPRRRC